MLSLFRPTLDAARRFVAAQAAAPYSYDQVGCSFQAPPPGFFVDRKRTRLGAGTAIFDAACSELRRWTMFNLGWVSVADAACPIEEGRVVGVLARVGILWTLNACRIVRVVDEPGRRFGFAYGTLGEHLERGEERFLIDSDEHGQVWFDLLAISRPGRWYAWVALPIARLFQGRFRRDSAAAMRRAVAAPMAQTLR